MWQNSSISDTALPPPWGASNAPASDRYSVSRMKHTASDWPDLKKPLMRSAYSSALAGSSSVSTPWQIISPPSSVKVSA